MQFIGPDRKRPRPAEALHFAGKLELRTQILQELTAVILLDHQHPLDPCERLREPVGLCGRQKTHGDEARLHPVRSRTRARLAHRLTDPATEGW